MMQILRGYGCVRRYHPFFNDKESDIFFLIKQTAVTRIALKTSEQGLVGVYHWPCNLKRVALIGGLYLVQLTLTSKGLSDVPLVRGLCHVQRTSTTKVLNELPLIGGLCLMQWTSTT